MTEPESAAGPLAGVRVIELATTFMGPYCAMQMARMGADVIKVEDLGGDLVRGISDSRGDGLGPIFVAANHGKRSISINLKKPAGLSALMSLIASADVFVTNMRPDALGRLGVTEEAIRAANRTVIYASLVGFGPGGEYAGLAAYDDVIQGVSGLAAVQGGTGAPAYVKAAVADKIVGLMALNGIVSALFARSSTGQGTTITVPMFESMAAFNLLDHQGGFIYEPPRGPTGYSRHASPFRKPYATSDGFLGVVVYTDKMWLSFFDLIGQPELSANPRYRTIKERTENIDELYELVEIELAKKPSDYWLETLKAHGIPAVPINTMESLMTDPHLTEVGFFEEIDHPVAGPMRLPRYPSTFSTGLPTQLRPAPQLAQHSREVLLEAGLADSEIDALIGDATVGSLE
jgi:crotonobetainyl-CoA:carnitine CoA-transferase CaiB-like acyl-CoA transferase